MSMSSSNSMQIATYSLQVANRGWGVGGWGGERNSEGKGGGDEAGGGGEL